MPWSIESVQSQDKHRNVAHHGSVTEHDPRGNDETAPIQADQVASTAAEVPTAQHPVLPPDTPPPAAGTEP